MLPLGSKTPVAVAIVMLAVTSACVSAAPLDVVATPFAWQRSTPEQQGVDSEMLVRAVRRIRDEDIDVRSLVLVRNDHVILELYVHPYTRDTVHNVKSVSKSILSALAGIALREGDLRSLDQPVREFFPDDFPEDPEDDKNRITLRHLLTMTAGLDLDENGPKMQAVFRSPDWIRATFETDMATPPGERFVYSTPLTHALVGVLTEASGQSALEFAKEHLFGPLEFGALQWTRGPRGYYFGGSELFLRTRDMAKFGLLYLHDGAWGERQIVPAEWVAESTRNQLPAGSTTRYGYWWWIDGDGGGFEAMGWGGQGIKVRRDLRLVATVTSGEFGASDRMFRDFDPTSLSDEPLPPNPAAVTQLAALIHDLEHPAPSAVPTLPAIATKISGVTYQLDENARDLRAFTFRFDDDAPTAAVVTQRGTETYTGEIGMDGIYRLTDMQTRGPLPERNQLALRGRWNDADEFIIDSHQVGDPVHATWTVRFNTRGLHADVEIHPTGQRFSVSGRSSAEPGSP